MVYLMLHRRQHAVLKQDEVFIVLMSESCQINGGLSISMMPAVCSAQIAEDECECSVSWSENQW